VAATGSEDPRAVAEAARAAFGITVAVTGATDVIVGRDQTYLVSNGSPLLGAITGSGCMATATIGIFNAAGDDPALQTALGLAAYGLAAERAAEGAPGPGTFRARLLDEVAALSAKGVDGVKIATG
jgi:hydroxyethylthiazole kinase